MTASLIKIDLLLVVLCAAAWIGAAVAALARRRHVALGLAVAGLLLAGARVAAVVLLAGHGWWFVQEKIALESPLIALAAVLVAAVSIPSLVTAGRETKRKPRAVDSAVVALPLFAGGYAAAAALVVTLLVGYPASPGVAVTTVAVICVALAVTWQVIDGAAARLVLGLGAGSLVLVIIGVLTLMSEGTAADTGGGTPIAYPVSGVSVASLQGPAGPRPGGVVRRVTLTARTALVTLPSGKKVSAWTFNGQIPGPQITAQQGDLLVVTLKNLDIKSGVTVHWHGYDVPGADDGAAGLTQDAVEPGGQFTYRFLADQTGTYWYHTHEDSDQGIHLGLYGSLVVTPRGAPAGGLDLSLPIHTFDTATVLGDQDRAATRVTPPGTPVRLRLTDTDNVSHRITLAGARFSLAEVDGTALHQPAALSKTALSLAAGARYDLEFTMPDNPVSLLVDDDPSHALTLEPAAGAAAGPPPATAGWPELDLTHYGTPAPVPFGLDTGFDRRFTLVLDRGLAVLGNGPAYAYTVNGEGAPHIPTLLVRQGDLVLMTVVNRSLDVHPWHLHGHHVLVLTRDGRPVTGSPLWVDSFDIKPGEVWQVAFRADNPGDWMIHCHNLDHASQGMSLFLEYAGVTEPYGAMNMAAGG